MADSSFDVVSKVDRQEVDNALNQAAKELSQRYDFRGTNTGIAWSGEEAIVITSDAEERAVAGLEVFKEKLIRRDISLKAFDAGEPAASGKQFKITGTLVQGIDSEHAKKISKKIRDEGPRASRRRSRATSYASPARSATTCRLSSRCSRARTSGSRCNSSTTGSGWGDGGAQLIPRRAISCSRAMRSSVGGCVEKSLAIRSVARNGFSIIA